MSAAMSDARMPKQASKEASRLTPMLAQYMGLKKEAGDALLFLRLGDFYELFLEDAVTAAEELDLVLTTRGTLDGEPVPMCGVPYHAYESYAAKLVRSGYSVAIAEQMEDPKAKAGKAPVERAIVRVLTAGTLTEERLLEASEANWLLACFPKKDEAGLAWCDISTGSFRMATVARAALDDELARIRPAEILWPEGLEGAGPMHDLRPRPRSDFRSDAAERILLDRFAVGSLDGFGHFSRAALAAAAGLLAYLEETARGRPVFLSPPVAEAPATILAIDKASRESLELLPDAKGSRTSLFSTIDRTVTPGGARLLAAELAAPLMSVAAINDRLDTVEWFVGDGALRDAVRQHLRRTPDLARALGRVLADRFGPRDLAAIRETLSQGEEIAAVLATAMQSGAPRLVPELANRLTRARPLLALLAETLAEVVPLLASDGGVIREGADPELDSLRALAGNTRSAIAALQQDLRNATAIPTLKVRHNNILGYHIEVPSRYAKALHDDPAFTHRQTLASSARFDTAELRTLASRILDARQQALAREAEHIGQLVETIAREKDTLADMARAIAGIDRSAALADLAAASDWCRPTLTDGDDFHITAGRHPVVERALGTGGGPFVPNDCRLEGKEKLWLVTGPNMGGKSTFLRQNALFAILAQMGSFVPATAATIGVVDRITSRVGASDNLAEGRSTFMVEMVETAALLCTATPRSLLLLDEVGRGTATWDGLALAWAILETIHDRIGARCLFATHYHELAELDQRLDRLALKTLRVREWKGELHFLHEIGNGAAESSFGLQVARLAGVPDPVIHRAREVLTRLESGEMSRNARDLLSDLPLFAASRHDETGQHEDASAIDPLRARLDAIEPDLLTPRAALDLLYELVALARAPRPE